MTISAVPGQPFVPIGPSLNLTQTIPSGATTSILDAANEAIIFIGHIVTSDGASHTIDTTGSSSIGVRTASVTFSDGGSTVKIGLAAVLTTAGPPGRAAHASDVITFDVNGSHAGGGGITANAWIETVPNAGTKTVAHGDLVALVVQMTARGGADSVQIHSGTSSTGHHMPTVTTFLGGSYANLAGLPNAIITFSDGALGYFYGSDVFSATGTRFWNSGSATKEYGQIYNLPFPTKIYGLYGWVDPDDNFDMVLYSDPLGTPVAEKTIAFDLNIGASASGRRISVLFPTPYLLPANTPVGAVYKPSSTGITAYYKTLNSATHRLADVWGASGYGISRASGAFANANSSLDHYYIGLLAGAFEHGVRPTYVMGI